MFFLAFLRSALSCSWRSLAVTLSGGAGGVPGKAGVEVFGKALGTGSGQEKLDLLGSDRAILSGFKAGEGQGAEGGADELQHEIVQRLEEASDLAVSPLGQGNAIPGVGGGLSLENELKGEHRTTVETNLAPGHPFEVGRREASLDFDKVGPGDLETGVEDPLGEVSVVGQEKGPLGLKVEPSDVKKGVDPGEVLPEGRAAFRIKEGGDDSLGLVEKEEEGLRLPGKGTAVHEDLLELGVNPRAGFGDHLPVHRDRTGGDELLGLSAGGDSPVGQNLVEPQAAIGLLVNVGVVGAPIEIGSLGCHVGILYSHSMVEGGLGEMSKTTRLIPGTVAMMRCEIRPRRFGSR